INIDLTITDNVNLTIFVFSGVVFVTQPGASYQWLDCDASLAPIPGETAQDFLPAVDGNYACQITLGTCTDTTACVFVEASSGIGFSDQPDPVISVYPNPVSEQLFVTSNASSFISLRMFNISGSEVFLSQNQSTD